MSGARAGQGKGGGESHSRGREPIDELFPELAFAFDGRIFVNVAGYLHPERLADRPSFVGWRLRRREFSWDAAQNMRLADLVDIVLGSDGHFYGGASRVPGQKRKARHCFRGAAFTLEEARGAWAEIDRLAANITIAVQR